MPSLTHDVSSAVDIAARDIALKVLWWHPKPMDYRLPLFQRIEARHHVRYFFLAAGDGATAAPATLSRRGHVRVSLWPRGMTAADIRALWRDVTDADVFVSSFLGNAYTVLGALFARVQRKPVVVWEEVHEFPRSWRGRLRRIVYRVLSPLADAYYVLGGAQQKALQSLGVRSDFIFAANELPGHDYGRVAPCGAGTPIAADAEPILYLGRLIPIKGVDVLVQAFARVAALRPRALLLIAGAGPELPRLQAMVRTLGLHERVRFLGFVGAPCAKRTLFDAARMLVVPSRRLNGAVEGGPIVVLEALSAGLQVIGTDALGSSTALIEPGVNGDRVAEDDVEALAHAMLRCLDPASIDRSRVRRTFDALPGYDHQAAQLNAALRAACERRRPAQTRGIRS